MGHALAKKAACCDGTHQADAEVHVCVLPSPLGGAGLEEQEESWALEVQARSSSSIADPTSSYSHWRGFREFEVLSRHRETRDMMTFTLVPAEGVQEVFSFFPGQSIKIKVDPDNSGFYVGRDYTLISAPGEACLQICVKRLPFGKVSNFLHEEATVGAKLLVSKPTGSFTAAHSDGTTAVLLSAGVGITPMVALLRELGPRVVLSAHVDKSEETHAFRDLFEAVGVLTQVQYTRKNGRPPRDIGARLARLVGTDHDWYICGPRGFMSDAVDTLSDAGADMGRVHIESFRPPPAASKSPASIASKVDINHYGCWVPRTGTARLTGGG